MLKRLFLATSILMLSALSLTSFAHSNLPQPHGTTEQLNQIIAYVNNGVITQAQFDRALASARVQVARSGMAAPNPTMLKQQVLDHLIYQKLQLQLVKKMKLKMPDSEINHAIKAILKHDNLTLSQLKAKLKKHHTTYARFRQDLRKQLLLTKIQKEAAASKVVISQKDIDAFKLQLVSRPQFATQYHIVDMLIPLQSNPNAMKMKNAEQEAQKITKALDNGLPLPQLNKHFPNVVINDMGTRPATALPTLFLNSVRGKKNGTIVGPVLAANGIHILKVVSHSAPAQAMPSEAKIKAVLFQQKFEKALLAWLKGLKKSAYVKVVVPQ